MIRTCDGTDPNLVRPDGRPCDCGKTFDDADHLVVWPHTGFGPASVIEEYDPDAILADPGAHPIHKMYAEINIGIRDRGERWSKCPNCGDPYQLTEEWSNDQICSDRCAAQYTAYLNNPEAL